MTAEEFLAAFEAWARARPDIEAVGLVGSHARGTATRESDIDLIVLTTDPARYLDKPGWISNFGTAEGRAKENWGKVTSLRVRYTGGLEVEYGLSTPEWASAPVDPGTRAVIAGGMRIMIDRRGILAPLQRIPGSPGS